MKRKIMSLLMVFALSFTLSACGSTSSTATKVYKQGEPASMFDANRKEMYSITINSVKVTSDYLTDYNQDTLTEANKKQILEVDYTYKNIAKSDESKLIITGQDLLVADSTGTVAQWAVFYPKLQPQEIPVGMSCNVQAYYGLTTVSDKVKISFTSQSYGKTLSFEVPITK